MAPTKRCPCPGCGYHRPSAEGILQIYVEKKQKGELYDRPSPQVIRLLFQAKPSNQQLIKFFRIIGAKQFCRASSVIALRKYFLYHNPTNQEIEGLFKLKYFRYHHTHKKDMIAKKKMKKTGIIDTKEFVRIIQKEERRGWCDSSDETDSESESDSDNEN